MLLGYSHFPNKADFQQKGDGREGVGHADRGQKRSSRGTSKCKDPSAGAALCVLGKARMSAACSVLSKGRGGGTYGKPSAEKP